MRSLLRIALRNVLRNRRRSLITFSAVFLALGIMVSIRGFLNGMQSMLRESIILGQSGALQVHRTGFLKAVTSSPLELAVPADAAFLLKIKSVKGVRAVTPRIAFGGMANANDTTAFAMFTGIDPVREPEVCPQRLEMISAGKTLDKAGPASAIFTPELSANLGLRLGQRATLLTNDKDGVMNALELDLIGAYGQPGLPLSDKKFGFVPITFAQELLRMEGRATEIAVAVHRLDDIERIKPMLQATVGGDYEVTSWHDIASFIDDVIASQNAVLNLIAGIFLFIALLGVTNTMLMSVLERTREIGTMMSVGVRRKQILALFLLEAALLGLGGGLLGGAAGGALVLYLGHRGIAIKLAGMAAPMHVHPFVPPGYILSILALAAGGAALAALWPALRASRLRPVEALASV